MANKNSSTMKMEVPDSCEILAPIYLTIQNHIPEDHNLKIGLISLQNVIREFLIITMIKPWYMNAEFIPAIGTLALLRCNLNFKRHEQCPFEKESFVLIFIYLSMAYLTM